MISQYFIGGMMPESANPLQQPETIIVIDGDLLGIIAYQIRLHARTRVNLTNLRSVSRWSKQKACRWSWSANLIAFNCSPRSHHRVVRASAHDNDLTARIDRMRFKENETEAG